MQKAEARSCMKIRRRTLDISDRQVWQVAAIKQLLSLPELQSVKYVYPFVSYGTEIDTVELIRYLLAEEKWRIGVPRVVGEKMEFVEIYSLEDLHPGAMNILEPVTGETLEAGEGLMLMPGLAFDRCGNRVGYGAGYYDKYLEQHSTDALYKLGYAFDFQVIDAIEAEEHDQKVDGIVTERGIYRMH